MYEKKNEGTLNKGYSKENEGHKNKMSENVEGHKNYDAEKKVNELVAREIEKARAEWAKELEARIASEREDATRLATMSSEERARVEMDRRVKDFESERQLYETERAEFEAAKELAAQGLPVNFAKMVADADRDVMAKNIEVFKAEYMKAIEAGLSDRLKGTLPRVSTEKENVSDPFLNGLGM